MHILHRRGWEIPESQATPDTRVSPATIRPQAPLAGANQFMMTRGVRLLLVVDEERETVLGVITATDLLGERPMQVAVERGLRRDELTVVDIMTPAARVQVMAFGYVQGARVGHVFESMRRTGRQHALVIDYDELPPFFMTIVSSSDHWLFVSSAGGLTAGRVNVEHSLFPYETDSQ